ncbi:MAG: hypothetical protein HY010_16940 [Acidobacteria bacterium]|nr:hypothetical protein [Acidobacteriota bacterium]
MVGRRTLGCFFCLFLVASAFSQLAPQATILRYQFNKGPNGAPVTVATDSGPFHLDGTVHGALTYSSNVTKGGGKFSLNASPDVDYVVLAQTAGNAPLLNQVQSFTLSALAMPTGGTTLDAFGDLVAGKMITNGSGACLVTYSITYSLPLQKFVGGVCGADGSIQFVTSLDTFPINNWYKLVLKYSTIGTVTNIKLMVNGKAEGTLKLHSFAGPKLGNAGFQVGASNFVCDTCQFRRNFIGFIDEVKLTGQVQ